MMPDDLRRLHDRNSALRGWRLPSHDFAGKWS
jgi:hypothetical protein